MNRNRALTLLVIALVVIDLSWTAAVDHRSSAVEDRIEGVERDQAAIAAFAGANASTESTHRQDVSLYAYASARGEAEVVPTTVTAIPADGVYLDVSDVSHTATLQESLSVAWRVANESRYRPARRGAVVALSTPSDWERVGGGSAALPMGLAFAATNSCAQLNESVAATGGLSNDGTVVTVEHVREKAVAARDRGASVFVVPSGQAVPVEGIEVVAVERFAEAAEYAIDHRDECAAAGRLHAPARSEAAQTIQ